MELKNPHNAAKAIACGVTAFLLAGSLALVGIHLIVSGDWKGDLLFLSVMGACLMILVVLVFIALFAFSSYLCLLRERQYRSLAIGDGQVAKKAPVQPDEQLALRSGESISLGRRRSWREIFTWFSMALIVSPILAFVGEMVIFFALPTLGHSPLNPFSMPSFVFEPAPASPPPSWLDWFSAAFPLAFGVFLLVAVVLVAWSELPQEIVVDDRGITKKTFLHKSQFIPWNDIALFVRSVEKKPGQLEGSYALWGKEHQVVFEIDAPPAARKQKKTALDTYMYQGGYALYRANAERLLATVVARAHVPLFAYMTPQLVKRLSQRYPHLLSLENIANAPLASQIQAEEHPVSMEGALPSEVRLGVRVSLPGLVLESLVWCGVLTGLFLGWLHFMPGFMDIYSSIPLPLPWFYVLLEVIVVPLSCATAYRRRRIKRPAVIADNQGLTSKTGRQDTTIFIPWGEIEAWAVRRLPRNGYEDRLYVVCSVNQTLTWVEPANAKLAGRRVEGDRQGAYRERAAQLHRLIAQRTGQPLREISAQPSGQV